MAAAPPVTIAQSHAATNDPFGDSQHWSALRACHYYRLILATLLLLLSLSDHDWQTMIITQPLLFSSTLMAYLGLVMLALPAGFVERPELRLQATVMTLIDIAVLSVLAVASGGLASDLPLLLVVTIAANGVLLPLRLLLALMGVTELALAALWLHDNNAALLDLITRPQPLTEQLGHILLTANPSLLRLGLIATSALIAGLATYALAERTRHSSQLAAQRAATLAELNQLNQVIVHQLQAGVLVVDAQDRLRLSNDAAASLLEHGQPEPGTPLAQLSPVLAQHLAAWRSGQPATTEPFRLTPGSTEIGAHFTALGAHPKQSDTLIALTDYHEVEQQLQRLKLAALGRMAASIAHELRNPLAAIGHAAQLLQESSSSSQRLSEIIYNNTRRANRIIGEVLDMARRDPAAPEDIALATWLDNWREEFLLSREAPQPQLTVTVQPDDLWIRFDPHQLRQVLDNLAGNACRYGIGLGEQAARIRVSATAAGDGGHALLELCDAGPGIPERARDQLFEPFHTTSAQGIGLGLYISRELCEANQGSLSYLPAAGGGSCFRIHCPAPSTLTGYHVATG